MFRRLLVVSLALTILVFGLPALPFVPRFVLPAQAAAGDTSRVSVSSAGAEGNGSSTCNVFAEGCPMSKDGALVAFESEATNLVSGDTNGVQDIFVQDRNTGSTERVSVDSSGVQGNAKSEQPSISADGRYVAFVSAASGLVAGDTNGVRDVFVRDRTTGTTTRVSADSSGAQGNDKSDWPSISGDGRYVAFASVATNLVLNDTNHVNFGCGTGNFNQCYDTFVHDRTTGTTTRVSVMSSGAQAQCCSYEPSISADGRYVAFRSGSPDLVSGDTNLKDDIFLHDRTTGSTTRISVSSSGGQANLESSMPEISDDGRYVAFSSMASNLEPGDLNGNGDVFVRDLTLGVTTRVSKGGEFGDQGGGTPSISGNGRYVSFTYATGTDALPAGIMVFDRPTGITYRVSRSSSEEAANRFSTGSSMSFDGRFVTFFSEASNLVSGDTNGVNDVFFRHRGDEWAAIFIPPWQTFGLSWIHAVNPAGFFAEPVNTATGAYSTEATDISLPGIGVPFVLKRAYTSGDTSQGPLGLGWTHSYSASLTIDPNGDVTLRSEDGQRLTFARQPDGSFIPASGGASALVQEGAEYKLTRHDQVIYRFDSQGRLTQMRDRNNQGLTFSYGADGKLSSATDSAGRNISFTHDASGLLTNVSLPDGRSVGYGYTSGLLTSVTDVRGNVTTYTYDAANRLKKILDANGNTVVENTYGSDGRVTEQLDALGNRTTYSWDPVTQTATMIDARGKVWKDVYYDNVLIQRVDPLGNTTTYGYDVNLNQASVTDARGNKTLRTYDARGNLLSETGPAPLSYTKSFTYDAQNNMLTSTDGRGNTASFEYDARGNLITETRPGNVITRYGRDPTTGLLTTLTDPRGKITRYEYDAAGNLIKETSPLGFVTTMGYDSAGRMTSRVEPRGNEQGANPDDYRTTFEYDAAGNLTATTDPLGNRATQTFDKVGNLKTRTDARNRITTFGYDAANHLTSVTAPDGTSVTAYAYDAAGNLIRRTDANLHVTEYGYDAANRLTSIKSPSNQLWTYEYDANGNRVKQVTPAGNATPDPADGTITYTYDALNRLTAINYTDTTPDVQFGYDANDNRTSMADGAGTETSTYDVLNRPTAITRGTQTFSYGYDASSNVTRRTYPDGTVADYSYDDDGRLSSVISGGTNTTYNYDAAGNLTRTTLPSGNGYVETRGYDRAGRVTEVKNAKGSSTLSSFTYTLDADGNPTLVTGTEGTTSYSYDQLHRVTEVCFQASCPGANDPFIRHTYDAVGNRLTEARSSGTTAYTYNAADELTSRSGPSGTVNYTYDTNGNQTAAGTRTFTYDLEDRLASTTSGSTTITYSYDGDGKRLQASSGSQASKKTNYVWDSSWSLPQLVLERDGNNSLLRRYLHGTDLISMTTGGAAYYYHYDSLGSTKNLTSSTGAVQWTYSYEPFGALRSEVQNDRKAPSNLMRFTGELLDVSVGLYHFRARQYDPATGRFLQRDPVDGPIRDPYVATYVYAKNRATVAVDPSGLWCIIYNSNGSCLGGGVVRGVGDFVYEHRWQIATFAVGAGCTIVSMGSCTVLIGTYLTVQTIDLTAQYDLQLSPRLLFDVACGTVKTVVVPPAWSAVLSPIERFSSPGCIGPPGGSLGQIVK